MKLGIKKVEFIEASKCQDWSFLERNASFRSSSFISGEWKDLKFSDQFCTFQEEWLEDENGKHSSISVTGNDRLAQSVADEIIPLLLNPEYIYRITTINGYCFIIGSVNYMPRFLFSKVLEGINTYQVIWTITSKSPHGALNDISA